MEMVNIIFSVLGAVASAIGIYQFFSLKIKATTLPELNIQPTFNDDQVVLIIDRKDKNKKGTLSHSINSFVEKYKPSEENTPYFVYNPKGFYKADQIRLTGTLSWGIAMTFLGVVFFIQEYLRHKVGVLIDNNGTRYVLGYTFLFISILPFYLSFKQSRKMQILKQYILYLAENEISVGVRMTQSRNKYNANKAN